MKKILTHLTGIVFVIAILAAAGCGGDKKQDSSTPEPNGSTKEALSPEGHIYLKDTLVNGETHLFMYDKHCDCGVIDDHFIVVKRNNFVIWKNAPDSRITEILHILPVGETSFWGEVPKVSDDFVEDSEVFRDNNGVFRLVIPEAAPDTIVKYEIKFTVEGDTTEHVIDPYLKVPDQ